MKIKEDLLLARGFKSEKELTDFLKDCKDANWVRELKEYYGLSETEEVEEEPIEEVEEPIEEIEKPIEEIEETTEIIEEPTEEVEETKTKKSKK